MPDLLIKEAELLQLDKIIAPIPTQYGLPLVNFFNQVGQLRAREAAQLKAESENKESETKQTPAPKKEKAPKA